MYKEQFLKQIYYWKTSNDYTEKSIEFAYYQLINNYLMEKYKNENLYYIDYNSPYSTDGIITLHTEDTTTSILIEAKYDKDFMNKKDIAHVLCQAVYYVKRLENEQKLIPSVILLASRNNGIVINTEHIIDYLFNNNYDYDIPANTAHTNIDLYNRILSDDKIITSQAFDIHEFNFDPKELCSIINDILIQSRFKETKTRDYSLTNKVPDISLQYSDYNLALLFNQETHNDYYFNTVNKTWYYWDKKIWSVCSEFDVQNYLQDFLFELSNNLSVNHSINIFRLRQRLLSSETIKNILMVLRGMNSRCVVGNNNMINLRNGIFDLQKKQLLDYNKKYFTTQQYDYVFQENPEKQLCNDKVMNDYLLYLLSLSVIESDKFIFFIGDNSSFIENVFNSFDFLKLETAFSDSGSHNTIGARYFKMPVMPIMNGYDTNNVIIIDCDKVDWLLNDFDKNELFSSIINCACYVDVPSHIEETVNEWNENNDLFLSWANEKLDFNHPKSFITMIDLNASFNEWTQSRNNSPVSLRFFSETIRNHKIFYNNNLTYKNRARVLKGMKQSTLPISSQSVSKIYEEGSQCSYISGVRFK